MLSQNIATLVWVCLLELADGNAIKWNFDVVPNYEIVKFSISSIRCLKELIFDYALLYVDLFRKRTQEREGFAHPSLKESGQLNLDLVVV